MNRPPFPRSGVPTRLEHWPSVSSTNEVALARAASHGVAEPLWIRADAQTAGRGRRGRTWVSPPGNLYASHLFGVSEGRLAAGHLPLAASLALRAAIDGLTGLGGRLALKWPNDVLLDGAKIAGILMEVTELAPHLVPKPVPSDEPVTHALVTGFGVNCASHPPAGDYPTDHLARHAPDLTPDRLFPALREAWETSLSDLFADVESGVGSVRDRWLGHGAGIGEPIVVRFETESLAGRFVGLDPAGRLMLEEPDGATRTIAAGDVFFATGTIAPGGCGGGEALAP